MPEKYALIIHIKPNEAIKVGYVTKEGAEFFLKRLKDRKPYIVLETDTNITCIPKSNISYVTIVKPNTDTLSDKCFDEYYLEPEGE